MSHERAVRFEDRGFCTFVNVTKSTVRHYKAIADALSRKLGSVIDVRAVHASGQPGHVVYTSSQGVVLRATAEGVSARGMGR